MQRDTLKKQPTGFTQISNELICQNTLSAKAKAIYCYLYSKPEDWRFYRSEIAKNFKEGRDAISGGIKELIEQGWIETYPIRDEEGKFAYTEYYIYTKPHKKALLSTNGKPVHGKSVHGSPVNGKPDTTNTDITNTDYTKTNIKDYIADLKNSFKKSKIMTYASKINNTDNTKSAYKLIPKKDYLKTIALYTAYVKRNKSYAIRLDKYLYAYLEGNLEDIEHNEINRNKTLDEKNDEFLNKYFKEDTEVIDTEVLQ